MPKIKNKIPVRRACADPDNSIGGGGGGGGGGRIASRGRFVPVFSSKKRMATYDLHGDPPPPLSPPISEVQTV